MCRVDNPYAAPQTPHKLASKLSPDDTLTAHANAAEFHLNA